MNNSKKEGFLIIYIIYFLYFFSFSAISQTLGIFLVEKGMNSSEYSSLQSLLSLFSVLSPIFIMFLHNKFTYLKLALSSLIISILAIYGISYFNFFIGILIAVAGLNYSKAQFNLSFSTNTNLSVDSSKRSSFLAVRDVFLYGGSALGVFVLSQLTKVYGFEEIYPYFSISYVIIFFAIIKVSKIKQFSPKGIKKKDKEKISFKHLLKNRVLLVFVIIKIFESLYLTSLIYLPFLAKDIGVKMSDYTLLISISLIITTLFAIVIAKISDKYEKKYLYVFDLAYDAVPAFLFWFTKDVTIFYIVFLMMSVKDILSPVSFAYKYDCFEDEDIKYVMPLLSSITSFIYILSPLVLGILWLKLNSLVFVLGGIASLFSAIIALLFLPKSNRSIL